MDIKSNRFDIIKTAAKRSAAKRSADKRSDTANVSTLPVNVTSSELKKMRFYGCTRIQLGIQHTNNS